MDQGNCPDERLGAMPKRNVEDRETKNQTERSIDRAIQTRKARPPDPLEETDQPEVTDRASNEDKSQDETEPSNPCRRRAR